MRNFIIILITFIFFSSSVEAQQNELSILSDNWRTYLINEEVNPEMVPYFFNLNTDGTWEDLDYTNRQSGNWPLRTHYWRTLEMARAFHQNGNKNYQDKRLHKNIHLAYNWWVDNDLVNNNWWYTQIGIPQSIGEIMLLMQASIDKEHWLKGMHIMDRSDLNRLTNSSGQVVKQTGQNLVWIASNVVLRSILKNDTTQVAEVTSKIVAEMQMAFNAEGIQPDYSFHQHGHQLQFGNYGLHFLEDQVKLMFILKGSKYDYSPEQIDLMRNYFMEGQRWVIWNGIYDINSCGRQLFPDQQLKNYERLKQAAKEMKEIDPNNKDLYTSICEENQLTGIKYFPFSELIVKRTNESFTSIRMCSSRIKGSESGNGENLSGYYLADGAMYVMKTGKEYYNIFPYWDWRKIPGTTAVQDTVKLPEIGFKSYTIDSDFVGGITYKDIGITSMQYKRDHITANKSYFLFPEFSVCLGSGINGKEQQHLQTTIEQSFAETPLYINNKKATINGTFSENKTTNIRSLWHNGSGYIINDNNNNVDIDFSNKISDWSKVINWSLEEEKPKRIFSLGINHGEQVNNEKYAYAVFPSITKEALIKINESQPYHILSNTEDLQAVQFDNYTSIVFHQPGTIKINNNISISSNVPAIIVCEQNKNGLNVSICDPTQLLKTSQITVSRTNKSGTTTSIKDITLPIGVDIGKPIRYRDM